MAGALEKYQGHKGRMSSSRLKGLKRQDNKTQCLILNQILDGNKFLERTALGHLTICDYGLYYRYFIVSILNFLNMSTILWLKESPCLGEICGSVWG